MKEQLKCKVIYESINSKNQLYLVSNREIKVGDWFINIGDNDINVAQIVTDEVVQYLEEEYLQTASKLKLRRIEASTDPSLNLPLIPQSFIEAYVKANGKIDEVSIETYMGDAKLIKTREDNTVIIHPTRTYTLEEMKSVHAYGCRFMFDKKSLTKREREENFDKWIEENL